MSPADRARYLIRCRSRRHQVAIDPARFWQPAGCPVCRTAVDGLRFRRFWMWSTGRAPRSRVRVPKLGEFTPLDGAAVLSSLALAAVAIGLRTFGDRWWLGTVGLFIGRWPFLLPLGPLGLMALASRRLRTIGLVAVGLMIGLIGVMGFSLGLGRWPAVAPEVPRIRVITFNMAAQEVVAARISGLIETFNPDVVALQECRLPADAEAVSPAGYSVHRAGGTCLVSRWPVSSVDEQPFKVIEAAGGSGQVTRYRIESPSGGFDLTNVHLETPRDGLEALFQGQPDALDLIDRGIMLRRIEARRARQWANEGLGPQLIVGDFNTPSESVIFQESFGDLIESFDRSGFGLGYTRKTDWIGVRIDHVLAGPGFRVTHSEVLPDQGSDHRPLLAELVLVEK